MPEILPPWTTFFENFPHPMSTMESFKKFFDLVSNRLSNYAGRSTFSLHVKPTQ